MTAQNGGHLLGRIPFDLELKGSEGKEFLGFSLSVRRSYKPEGEQYYPEDLLYCKAFGGTAKFLGNNFKKGDSVSIAYELRRDDDYTPDGASEPVKGQMYAHVTDAAFTGSRSSGGADSGESKPKSTPSSKPASKPAGTNPLAGPGGKKTPGLNPLAGKKNGSPF